MLVQEMQAVGFAWYGGLFIISSILMCVVAYKNSKTQRPNYGFVLQKESMVLLRLSWALPLGSLLLGIVCLICDFKAPRDDILDSIMLVRTNNVFGFILFSLLNLMALLLVVNAYSLVYSVRSKFQPLFPTAQEAGGARACLVGVWNGFWGPPMYFKLGNSATLVCADEWTHPSTKNAMENIVAEGVPEQAVESVTVESYMNLGLPSHSFDVVFGNSLRALSTDDDKQQAVAELYKILKPNGILLAIVTTFSVGDIKSKMYGAGFINISVENCWFSFLPVALIKASKPADKEASNAPAVAPANFMRVGGSMTMNNGVSINDETSIEMRENASLIPKRGGPNLKETHQALRYTLLVLLAAFMIGYVVVLFAAWPTLDIPKSITTGNRITSGWLVPIATSFVLMLLQIAESLREHSTENGITSSEIVKKFIKYFLTGFLASGFINMIFWLPSMLIQLYMIDHNVSSSTASVVNTVVIVLLIYGSIKLGMYMSKRRREAEKK